MRHTASLLPCDYGHTWAQGVILLNRPLRTRMVGGVGAGGQKPLATRLNVFLRFDGFLLKLLCCIADFVPIWFVSHELMEFITDNGVVIKAIGHYWE